MASAHRSRKRRLPWIAAGGVLVVAAIIGLSLFAPTMIARYVLTERLKALRIEVEGVETLGVDLWRRQIWLGPIDFHGLDAEKGRLERLGVEVSLAGLINRQLLLKKMILEGVAVDIAQAEGGVVRLNGITVWRPASPDAPPLKQLEETGTLWRAGLDEFEMQDSRVTYERADGRRLNVTIDRLTMREFFAWSPDLPGSFEAAGKLNGAPFALEGKAWPFADTLQGALEARLEGMAVAEILPHIGVLIEDGPEGVLSADMRLELAIAPNGRVAIETKGEVSIKDVKYAAPSEFEAGVQNATIELETDATIAENADLEGAGRIEFVLSNGEMASADQANTITADQVAGAFTNLAYRRREAETSVSGKAELRLTTLSGQMPRGETQAAFAAKAFSVAASSLAVSLAPPSLSVEASASVDLGGLSVTWPKSEATPALSGQLMSVHAELGRVAIDRTDAGLGIEAAFDTTAEGVAAMLDDSDAGKAEIAKFTVAGGALQSRTSERSMLAVDSVSFSEPNIEMTDKLVATFRSKQEPDAETAATGGQWQIGRMEIADTGTLTFVDTAVQPRVRIETEFDVLEVENLDSGSPDQQSPVKLDSTVNEFTKMQLVGWIAPFQDPVSFSFAGRLGDLALPGLSPYAAETFGLHLEQGSLSAKADAEALEGDLRGRIELDVDNLAFTPLSQEDAQRLSARIGLPLDTIVALLRDSGGHIDLTIPISGDLGKPEFDFSQAIGRALVGAFRAAITAPFRFLLEPVGDLFGEKPAFKPVVFAPAERALDAPDETFLNALADMLQERPGLRLEVCGRATAEDLEAGRRSGAAELAPMERRQSEVTGPARPASIATAPGAQAAQAKLEELAVERARAVRRYLVEEGGIQSERIGECRSMFDRTDQGPPRVEIVF